MDTLLIAMKLIEDGKIKLSVRIFYLKLCLKIKKNCKWSVPLKYIIFSIAFSG